MFDDAIGCKVVLHTLLVNNFLRPRMKMTRWLIRQQAHRTRMMRERDLHCLHAPNSHKIYDRLSFILVKEDGVFESHTKR